MIYVRAFLKVGEQLLLQWHEKILLFELLYSILPFDK